MQAAALVLIAQQDSLTRALDVVANNVANASTTGFKREELQFETFVSRPAANEKIDFAVERGTLRDTAAGPLLTTGNPFDVAIQGAGYFPIQTREGTRYTRGGAFQLNGAGELITAGGDKVLGEGDQPITLPSDAEDVQISGDGVIAAKSGGGTTMTQVGKLKLVKFANEQALQSVGSGFYTSSQPPEADTESRLVQGTVEQSNVRSVSEITHMIEIMRAYQMSVHLLDLDNQRRTNAIDKLARTSA